MKKILLSIIALMLSAGLWAQEIDDGKFVEEGLKFEVTSLDPKTVKVIANDYTGSSFTIPATVSYSGNDYAVTAIGENAFALIDAQATANNTICAAVDMIAVANAKDDAIDAIRMATGKAVAAIEAAIQEFIALQQNTIEEIKQVAATAKEEIDGLGVDDIAKSDAKAQIDNIVSTAKATINDATNKDMINDAKTQAITKIHNVVQTTKDMWVTVRTDGTAGNWNTICLERDITAIDGATFWTVSGQDATSFILDEVTEPEAGQGYLIRFTATELKVKYGDQKVTEPVTATYDNPIQGTFTQIDFDQYGQNVLVGNYVVYNNQLCPVEAWVGMKDHRAYVVADLVPNNAPAPAPGRARVYMPKPDQTPTELESVDGSQRTIRNGKFLRNGQLIIVKDNKMYNVQGMKL